MLCEGTVVEMALLEMGTLPNWVMADWVAEEIWYACAVPLVGKFARLMATGVLPCCLLITMTVSAPSEERTAAKDESLSGFATVTETLVSPNVESLPS